MSATNIKGLLFKQLVILGLVFFALKIYRLEEIYRTTPPSFRVQHTIGDGPGSLAQLTDDELIWYKYKWQIYLENWRKIYLGDYFSLSADLRNLSMDAVKEGCRIYEKIDEGSRETGRRTAKRPPGPEHDRLWRTTYVRNPGFRSLATFKQTWGLMIVDGVSYVNNRIRNGYWQSKPLWPDWVGTLITLKQGPMSWLNDLYEAL